MRKQDFVLIPELGISDGNFRLLNSLNKPSFSAMPKETVRAQRKEKVVRFACAAHRSRLAA